MDDSHNGIEVAPPTKDGWYCYADSNQTLIFRLTRGQWYAIQDNGTMAPCVWGYIEQALSVETLVPMVPKTSEAHLSRMLFYAREQLSMWSALVTARRFESTAIVKLISEIDNYRKAKGWSPNDFGGEDD